VYQRSPTLTPIPELLRALQLLPQNVRHNLTRSPSDRHESKVTPPPLRKELSRITVSTVNLNRFVRYPDGVIAHHPLRRGYEGTTIAPRAQFIKRAVGEGLTENDAALHLLHVSSYIRELVELFAKRFSLTRVSRGGV
jgi:hypothetical protein